MSRQYGPETLWRALKADILSLTAFQVGLYGWMTIYQIAIWDYKLEIPNVVYWWMMQVRHSTGRYTTNEVNMLLCLGRHVPGSLDSSPYELVAH